MLLETENLSVRYGRVRAVEDVSIHVGQGEVVAVLGANGAGKSSLLRAVLGLERASGEIRFAGSPISAWATARRVASGLSLAPEGRRILIEMTIHDNLLLGATARQDEVDFARETDAVYDRFPNLAARRDMLASCLSGGEQQMLAIGRAMMARPKLLMLDEPSLGLSPIVSQQLFGLLRDLNGEGLSILVVEQNTSLALSIADRAYVLENGRQTIEASPDELRSDSRLTEAYLGGGPDRDGESGEHSRAPLPPHE